MILILTISPSPNVQGEFFDWSVNAGTENDWPWWCRTSQVEVCVKGKWLRGEPVGYNGAYLQCVYHIDCDTHIDIFELHEVRPQPVIPAIEYFPPSVMEVESEQNAV